MTILVDQLFDTTPFTGPKTPRCFRNTLACHCWSDLPGAEGEAELRTFAKKLGLRAAWFQHPGASRQHFELTANKRAKAIEAGAQDGRWCADTPAAKRNADEMNTYLLLAAEGLLRRIEEVYQPAYLERAAEREPESLLGRVVCLRLAAAKVRSIGGQP